MKRLLTRALLAAALVIAPLGGLAQSTSNGTAVRASLGAANATATVSTPSGTSACGIGVTGTFSGTITFKVSDGLQWSAVNVYPANSTTAQTTTTTTGSFNANVAGFGAFEAVMTSYSSGTAIVNISCSTAVAHTQGGGSGGGGGGVTSVSAGNQIAVTGTDTEPVVAVVTTPSFSTVSATTVSATSVNSTNVTASSLTNGQCVQAGTGGVLQASGGACGASGGTPYDTTILAEPSLTHYWPLNDAALSSAAADAKGSVNLTVEGSGLVFGAPPITHDAETCLYFDGNGSDYLDFPNTPLIPASGDYTVEMVVSLPGWFPSGTPTDMFIYSSDSSYNSALAVLSTQSVGGLNDPISWDILANATSGTGPPLSPSHSLLIDIVASGSTTTLWMNAVPTAPVASVGRQSGVGKVGQSTASSAFPYLGYESKFAIYSSALSQAQMFAHLANL
jgi:hypothetical protein